MLSGSTLLILGGLWGVVLLPRVVRDVRASPVSTAAGFSDAMARLAVCDQRTLVVPTGSGRASVVHPRPSAYSRRAAMLRRRRSTLVRLIVGAIGTLAVAIVAGGSLTWALAGVSVTSLVVYCVALRLVVLRRRRTEAVVDLHPARTGAVRGAVTTAPRTGAVRRAVTTARSAPTDATWLARTPDALLVADGG